MQRISVGVCLAAIPAPVSTALYLHPSAAEHAEPSFNDNVCVMSSCAHSNRACSERRPIAWPRVLQLAAFSITAPPSNDTIHTATHPPRGRFIGLTLSFISPQRDSFIGFASANYHLRSIICTDTSGRLQQELPLKAFVKVCPKLSRTNGSI